jgi:hypothetical protein
MDRQVEFTEQPAEFLLASNSTTPQADEVINTLVDALESAISSLRKAVLARRTATRVHRIQAGWQ